MVNVLLLPNKVTHYLMVWYLFFVLLFIIYLRESVRPRGWAEGEEEPES